MFTTLLAAAPVVTDAVARDATTADWVMLGLYLVIAIGVSFLCSLLEAGILSLTPAYVSALVEQGSSAGRKLQQLKTKLDQSLAAILTLNTIAHTVGAAGAGAQVFVIFGSAWVALGSAIVTLLILVFSEIIPKSLGAAYAKPLAPFTAWTIQLLIWLLLPVLIPLGWLARVIGGGHQVSVSREEVASLARLGLDDGAINNAEARVIHNLLELSRVKVKDVMTPRQVMFALAEDLTVAEALEQNPRLRFSRIPIYEGDLDHVTGAVTRAAIFHTLNDGDSETTLKSIGRDLPAVPELSEVGKVLDRMIREERHVLLVVDEFGGTSGLITLEDCIETLLGVEIVDETDVVTDMRELAMQLMRRRQLAREADTAL